MKKTGKRVCALALATIMALSMSACGKGKGSNEDSIDNSRTQLYVYNYNGGFGGEWLNEVKKRYEELHKDDVYEEGKKGIQIVVNNSKKNGNDIKDQILYNSDEVYFTEYAYYYTLKEIGALGDITEAVTADLKEYGDEAGTTIESKMTDEQKAFYGVEEDGKTKYYGIPHYAGYTGLIYNVDLFENEKYYFADGVTDAEYIEDYFIAKSTDKKSAGPDGQYDTSDDGLPTTYDEFFLLCEYIAERGQVPVNWLGTVYDDYLENLMTALEANSEGKEQMMLNYTMNGTATSLGTATADGFVKDAAPTELTAANGYEVYRQEGKYEALKFLHTLVTNDKFHNSLAFNSGYSHMNAQEDFLYAGNDGGQTVPIAMLLDGIWWESEATATFKDMENSMGDDYSKMGRNFAFMPLPKASADEAGQNVLLDHIYSMCFIKGNIEDWKKEIALDFIKFANSNESLVEFTQVTGTPKALNYTLTDKQMEKMTPFGRSVMELKQNSEIVYPFSKEAIYVNQSGSFQNFQMWNTLNGDIFYGGAALPFNEGKITAEDYFNGLTTYYKSVWGQKVY